MRAIVCSPSSPYRIEFRDVPEPVPAPDETVIAQRAFSLNRGEFRRLSWEIDGWRPGYDVAGVVVRAAADGSGPREGSRVAGVLPGGAWAERVAVPTRHVAEIPDAVDFVAAATVPVAGLTSRAALRHGGSLLARRVLITGAAGGVGRFACQLAALMGAHVTAQVGRPERASGLVEIGVAEVVIDLERKGPLFDLVVESVGGTTLAAALDRLAPGGCVVSIGASSDEPTTFDSLRFIRKGSTRLYGMHLFQEMERQGLGSRDLSDLLGLVAAGRLDPGVSVQASWREIGPLLAALGDRKISGKAVVLVDGGQ